MTFLWPEMLWLLAAVPALVALYILILRRKRKLAVRYASLSLVKDALAGQSFRRHVPPLLFLGAITAMLVAVARPAAVITLPSQHETVILAIDVSGSMKATDVEPSRLGAAQAAAKTFIAEQPRTTRVGVVSFAGTAALVQPPTRNRDELVSAVERLQLQRATAVGSGLLVSLQALFPDMELDLAGENPRPGAARGRTPFGASAGGSSSLLEPQKSPPPPPVPPGSYTSGAIILLTDGQTTTGPDPIEAARMAAERGVRVFTVGIGTPDGEIVVGDGWSMRVQLDEEALKTIADITRGQYFYAGTAFDLKKIYQSLNSRFVLEKKETEVTALFSAAAALLGLLAAGLSLLWFNRII
jgi:Ca-activated chloride channel homolog